MTSSAFVQIGIFLGVLALLAWPLGRYMTWVFERCESNVHLSRAERAILNILGIANHDEMNWKHYALSVLSFSLLGIVVVYSFQRFQGILPLNPEGIAAVPSDLAFNTALSFVTNTNWQAYSGESTLSYLTQMAGLTVQNFVSAATGIAVLFALMRGFVRVKTDRIGNFWRDLTFATTHILLPLSIVVAIILVSQGVVQTFSPYAKVSLVESNTDSNGEAVSEQTIPLGPAASQVAIKQLGTNGGGFFGVNSAHPLENPTPLSNFVQVLSILLIPAALCITFGCVLNDPRQGLALLASMTILFIFFCMPTAYLEKGGNSALDVRVDQTMSNTSVGGNLEGKEVRFGPINSAIWATATTAASNGSVNSMHDSFTPLGGMFPMILMQLGEVVFGGVGSGLYGMVAFAIVAVFIAGLMVGRTPEYLGKKIGGYEMKMVSLVVLIPCALVLMGTAIALSVPSTLGSITNPGPHGLSQALYAYSSMGNNNGSAFAGFGANVPLHNFLGGIIMFVSRFWLAIPVLALAGALAAKTSVPSGPGTLETHTPLFVALLCGTVLLVGALTFIPALALGPIAEHIQLYISK